MLKQLIIVAIAIAYFSAIDSALAGPTFAERAAISGAASMVYAHPDVARTLAAAAPDRHEAPAARHPDGAEARDADASDRQPALALQNLDFRQFPPTAPDYVTPSHAADPGWSFPQPGPFTGIVATIALALFFFLRRVSD